MSFVNWIPWQMCSWFTASNSTFTESVGIFLLIPKRNIQRYVAMKNATKENKKEQLFCETQSSWVEKGQKCDKFTAVSWSYERQHFLDRKIDKLDCHNQAGFII